MNDTTKTSAEMNIERLIGRGAMPEADDAKALTEIIQKLPYEQRLIMYGQAVALAAVNNIESTPQPAAAPAV